MENLENWIYQTIKNSKRRIYKRSNSSGHAMRHSLFPTSFFSFSFSRKENKFIVACVDDIAIDNKFTIFFRAFSLSFPVLKGLCARYQNSNLFTRHFFFFVYKLKVPRKKNGNQPGGHLRCGRKEKTRTPLSKNANEWRVTKDAGSSLYTNAKRKMLCIHYILVTI